MIVTAPLTAVAPPVQPTDNPTGPAPRNGATLDAPVARHESLGTLKFNWGLEECETWWSRDAVRAGSPFGAKAGYATLKDAVADLAPLTEHDSAPSVFVLREGGRFVARTLEAKTLTGYERDGGPQWHKVDEIPGNMDIMEVRRDAVDPRVAAIVDGRLVHTFQAR